MDKFRNLYQVFFSCQPSERCCQLNMSLNEHFYEFGLNTKLGIPDHTFDPGQAVVENSWYYEAAAVARMSSLKSKSEMG